MCSEHVIWKLVQLSQVSNKSRFDFLDLIGKYRFEHFKKAPKVDEVKKVLLNIRNTFKKYNCNVILLCKSNEILKYLFAV